MAKTDADLSSSRSIGWRIMAVVALTIVVMPIIGASTAGAEPSMVRLGRLAPSGPPTGAVGLGAVSNRQRIGLELILSPSHRDELTTLLRSLNDAGSPQYHRWLSPEQFAQRFDPPSATISEVMSWLTSVGLHPTYHSGFAVHISDPASAVESGFGVSLRDYRLERGQRVHISSGAPRLPAAWSANVVSVLGLDDAPQLSPHIAQSHRVSQGASILPHAEGLSPCSAATLEASAVGGATPDEVGAAYGVGSLTAPARQEPARR